MKLKYTLLVLAAMTGAACATTFAVNFNGNTNSNAFGTAFGIAATDWNNLDGASGQGMVIVASNFNKASISWTSINEWSMASTLPNSEGGIFKGYIDDGIDGANNGVTINVAMKGLYLGTYSVTVYQSSDQAGTMGWRPLTVNEKTVSPTKHPVDNTATTTIKGLTGDLNIISGGRYGTNRGSISGFVVEYKAISNKASSVPPSSISPSSALISVGGIMLILK